MGGDRGVEVKLYAQDIVDVLNLCLEKLDTVETAAAIGWASGDILARLSDKEFENWLDAARESRRILRKRDG